MIDNQKPQTTIKDVAPAVASDSVTEPGFLFETGNSVISYPVSENAAFISLGVAALALSTSVARHVRRLNVKLPKVFNRQSLKGTFSRQFAEMTKPVRQRISSGFNKLVDNPGLGLNISGVALLTAATIAGAENLDLQQVLDLDWDHIKSEGREAMIIASYGIGNSFMGFARAVKQGSNLQKTLDSIGLSFAAMGSMMAGDNSHWSVKALFGASAGFSSLQAFKILPTHYQSKGGKKYPLAPEYLAMGGYAGNAITSTTPELKWANALFCVAYLSILSLKETRGKGLYEYLNKFIKFDDKHHALIETHDRLDNDNNQPSLA